MTANEFLELTNECTFIDAGNKYYIANNVVRQRLVCNDGFTISVQANEYAYCTPRISQGLIDGKLYCRNAFGFDGKIEEGFTKKFIPYTKVELGYPSQVEPDILPYAEDSDNPTNTVYGYVPIEIVDAVVKKHGGINVISCLHYDYDEPISDEEMPEIEKYCLNDVLATEALWKHLQSDFKAREIQDEWKEEEMHE